MKITRLSLVLLIIVLVAFEAAPRLHGQSNVYVGSQLPQVRVTNSGAISTSSGTGALLTYDTDVFDSDNLHYTSAANLTGTVSKNGTTTLTGSSTLFSSELSVGQVIAVPGTAVERRVVTAIASNTSLTVSTAFVNSASGQTATRQNGCLVARTAGTYQITATIQWQGNAVGERDLGILLNADTVSSTNYVGYDIRPPASSGASIQTATSLMQLAQWDFVDTVYFQSSTSTITIQSTAGLSPVFMMIRVSP